MWPFSRFSPSPVEAGPVTLPLLEEPAPQVTHDIPLEDPASLALQDDYKLLGYSNERLSMPPALRWPLLAATTFLYGASLGMTVGGRKAADRYRAMNAHRLPSTQAGWYLYHRSKSYHTTVGGVKEGVKFGTKLSLWASLFMLAEEGLDQARGRLFAKKDEDVATGQRDTANTVMAALTTVGLYSRWHRMDVFATTKMASMSLKYGLMYGLAQDALASLRGEPPAYLRWLRRKTFGSKDP